MTTRTITRTAAAAAMALGLGGCGGNLGALGDVLGGVLGGGQGGAGQGQMQVEVQGVDTRQQSIQVRTQDGRTGAVRYDQNTQVIYRQQQYPVTALERGDVGVMDVQQLQNNQLYASRVLVQQSVRERTGQAGGSGVPGAAGQTHQLSGRVGQINGQAGMFELQTPSGNVTVSMPANASGSAVNRFRNLRPGDTVSLEGAFVATGMVELYRFL